MKDRTCVIIPCYNEAARLKSSDFGYFIDQFPSFDLCFVNDGSSDNTMAKISEFADQFADQFAERVFVVDCPRNGGKAEAVRQGVLRMACSGERYRWFGWADADLATPLEELCRLADIAQDENLTMVLGSRLRHEGSHIERRALRHYPGRMFATVIESLFHFNIHDTQCGAKIFDSAIAQKVFSEPFISKWLFDIEVLLRIRGLEYRNDVREIPLAVWIERDGSKVRLPHLMAMPWQLCKIYFRYRSKTKKQEHVY